MISWRGGAEVEGRTTSEGTISLHGVLAPAFQMVRLPRIWDDSERQERERSAGNQIDDLAKRMREAFDLWMVCAAELAKRIRCVPRPSESDPWRRGKGDSLAGEEPETTH